MSKRLIVFALCFLAAFSMVGAWLLNRPSSDVTAKLRQIAVNYTLAKESWDDAVADDDVEINDGNYEVYVWRRPSRPGSYRIVIMDAEGEILEYQKGR